MLLPWCTAVMCGMVLIHVQVEQGTIWCSPVTCMEHRVQHALEEQTIAHPLGNDDIYLHKNDCPQHTISAANALVKSKCAPTWLVLCHLVLSKTHCVVNVNCVLE